MNTNLKSIQHNISMMSLSLWRNTASAQMKFESNRGNRHIDI